jgi:Bacterial Ig domain
MKNHFSLRCSAAVLLLTGWSTFQSWGQTEYIQNGGFEAGESFWTIGGAPFGIADNTAGYSRSGAWYAWLGGVLGEADFCYQQMTIPPSSESATLSFYYNINSADGGSVAHDFFLVRIRDTNDIVLATLLQRDNRSRDSGHGPAFYHNATFDLMPYAGQPIKVQFESGQDNSLVSNFYVDDVSVQVVASIGNHRPVATPQNLSVPYSTPLPITLTGTDVDGNFLTYAIATQPANGNVIGTPPNVTYVPNFGYSGPDSFTFTANDGQTNSAPGTISLTVNPRLAGLIINPTWDSTILSDPNAAAIMNTISNAILVYQTKFSDNVTVNITFAEMGSGLGMSQTAYNTIFYSDFYNGLVADGKTANDLIALAHIPSNGGISPVDNNSYMNVTTANQRAIGIPFNPGMDGTIYVNMALINIDRISINASKYDLMAVVSHEIDEVLGTSSSLSSDGADFFSRPADLFRYTSAGARTYNTASPPTFDDAWFSIDGTTRLVQFNQEAGADYGDWKSKPPFVHTPRVQDAYGTPGVQGAVNLGVELTFLDVIGWDLVIPAPAPAIQRVFRSGNTINFSWGSAVGHGYQVQYKTNLTQTGWLNLGSPITALGTVTTSSDTIGPGPRRFYRIGLLPSSPAPPTVPQANFTSAGPYMLKTNYFLPQQATEMKGQSIKSVPGLQAEPAKR